MHKSQPQTNGVELHMSAWHVIGAGDDRTPLGPTFLLNRFLSYQQNLVNVRAMMRGCIEALQWRR